MKKFENPEIQIEEIKLADIIVTSGECERDCVSFECEWHA